MRGTHPCKERKDGAPSFGLAYTEILKGWPPASVEVSADMPFFLQKFLRFREEHLVFQYFTLVFTHWQAVLWGPSVLAVIWGMHFIVGTGTPPEWVNWTAVVLALFVAGYYTWRADHIRLVPKFSVNGPVIQPTETEDPNVMKLYVQIVPECTTEAPVEECQARLLRVWKRHMDNEEWSLTSMNAPLILGWDYYGHEPLTLQPGIQQRLDICYWSKDQVFIVPTVYPLPSKFRTVFNSIGTFKFDVRFTAKDCKPVDVSVTVCVDDCRWDKPHVSFFQGFATGSVSR